MADPSCRGTPIRKPPGLQSRRRAHQPKRHDSLISTEGKTPNDRRSRSPRRGTQDIEWARFASQVPPDLPSSLPAYNPKPLLHREDAFRVVEEAIETETMHCAGLETDDSTEYDSDELEFCTTQFPEFGEGCIYDFGP